MNRYNVLLANAFKSLACLVLLTSLLAAVLLATAPAPGYAQEPELTEQCVDFGDWKEGEYKAKFVKDNFIFTNFNREPLFIGWIDTPEGAALGLQIPEGGVNVSFPQPASQVVLHYVPGTAKSLEIIGFTSADGVIFDRTFPPTRGIINTITVPGCASIDIRGGGNESVLLEVCIEVESEQPVAEPFITRVEPTQGRCGSEMVLTVFGANFRSGLDVFIPEGIKVAGAKFISPEELQVGISIAPDIPPGPRPVEIIDLESREPVAILEAGFTVVCPRPQPPEGRPDLVLLWADWEIFGEDLLIITAEVENVGEVPAPEAPIYVESRTANWWATEAIVPGLDSGSSAEVRIELGIPDELRDMSHPFLVVVDPGGEIAELRVDNNWQDIEVWIGEGEPLFEPPDLLLPVVIVVGVAVVVTTTLTIKRSRTVRRHKRCQENAKEEEPPDTCQPCTRYCRKIELELKPARRKIARLSLRTGETVSSESSKESELPDEIVAGLNKVITSRRQREEAVRLQGQIASLADRTLEHVMEWLRGETAPQDVSITGHLEGGKVTCQFILYHCKRRGNMNVWEEEEKWKATVEDKRDEPVGILGGLNPAEPKIPERLVSELTRLLTEFIEKV